MGLLEKDFIEFFFTITKLGFSVLAKNVKWRRNSSSARSTSNTSSVNSIQYINPKPPTFKPSNHVQISEELREAFVEFFTSFLVNNVS